MARSAWSYYEYVALDGACTAGLTPYQEVASGYDNEKFNADFGAGIPPLQSRQTNMTFDKNGQTSIGLGGTIDYTMTFTLPDVDTTNSMVITVGSPSMGMPLTYYETVPDGLWYMVWVCKRRCHDDELYIRDRPGYAAVVHG